MSHKDGKPVTVLQVEDPAFGRDLRAAGPGGGAIDPKRQAAGAKAAATYNAAADHFDEAATSFWARYGRRSVERLGLPLGGRVLDVGCGSGASALPAATAVGPGGQVIAVDLAAQMLARTARKAGLLGLGNLETLQADMAELPFPDEQFDAVVSVFSLFFVTDMEQQVARLWRLVRPGGKLAITTWFAGFCDPCSEIFWDWIKAERPALYDSRRPWTRVSDPDALRRVLQGGGVTPDSVVVELGEQPLRKAEDWWTIVLGSGYRWTVDQLDPIQVALLREANLARIRERGITAIEATPIYAVATKGG